MEMVVCLYCPLDSQNCVLALILFFSLRCFSKIWKKQGKHNHANCCQLQTLQKLQIDQSRQHMFNGQCIIISTNLPLPHFFSPLLIFSNLQVFSIAVMHVIAVEKFAGTLHVINVSLYVLLYSIMALLYYYIFLSNAISCFTSFRLSQRIVN